MLFFSSLSEFMDPLNLLFSDDNSLFSFQCGAVVAFVSYGLSVIEIIRLHLKANHPVYGKLTNDGSKGQYGSV